MAQRTPKTRNHREQLRLSDEELRSSIAQIGCLLPVLRWQGRILDGARRKRIAAGVAKSVLVVELKSRTEAARALWAVHPERALSIFPEPSLQESADLFGTSPARVAQVRSAFTERPEPSQSGRMAWSRRRSADLAPFQSEGRALKVQFWISPELREEMRLARVRLGARCTEAAFIRRAIAAALENPKPPA